MGQFITKAPRKGHFLSWQAPGRVLWPALLMLCMTLAACAGKSESRPDSLVVPDTAPGLKETQEIENHGRTALKIARGMIGTPYRYGGNDPRGFDCSGLVRYAYGQAGITLPRISREIFRLCQPIPPQAARPGDLLFFTISSDKIAHVGIYAENRRFIHAPSSGKGVGYASLDNPYWQKRLVAVGRVVPENR